MNTWVKATTDRLDLSDRVLKSWAAMVKLGQTPAENLRLVEAELEILKRYRVEDPQRVDELIKGFEGLADHLRRSLN